jgi:TPR repeat protein
MTRFASAVVRALIMPIGAIALTGSIFAADSVPRAVADLAEHNPIAQLRHDAEKGNEKAQYMLGCCYNGDYGLAQDSIEAAKWWGKAAANGVADAQYCLGLCYYKGQGVAKDVAAAAKWWRTAADHDQPDAQYFLGLIYYVGMGVPRSPSLAIYWLHKSADAGNLVAVDMLAKLDPSSR